MLHLFGKETVTPLSKDEITASDPRLFDEHPGLLAALVELQNDVPDVFYTFPDFLDSLRTTVEARAKYYDGWIKTREKSLADPRVDILEDHKRKQDICFCPDLTEEEIAEQVEHRIETLKRLIQKDETELKTFSLTVTNQEHRVNGKLSGHERNKENPDDKLARDATVKADLRMDGVGLCCVSDMICDKGIPSMPWRHNWIPAIRQITKHGRERGTERLICAQKYDDGTYAELVNVVLPNGKGIISEYYVNGEYKLYAEMLCTSEDKNSFNVKVLKASNNGEGFGVYRREGVHVDMNNYFIGSQYGANTLVDALMSCVNKLGNREETCESLPVSTTGPRNSPYKSFFNALGMK